MRFVEMLVAATAVSGFICLVDVLFLKHRRMKQLAYVGSYERVAKEPKLVEYARSLFPVLLVVLILRSFILEPFKIPSGSMKPTLFEGDFILVNRFTYGLRLPIVGNKIMDVGNPQKGDVVVFKHDNGKDLIKRVIGLPGDHIEYKEKVLYINGIKAEQTFETITEDISLEVKPASFWLWRLFFMKDYNPLVGKKVDQKTEQLEQKSHAIYVQTESLSPHYRFDDVIVPANNYFVMGDNRDNSEDSRYWGFVKDEDLLGRAFLIWMSWDSIHSDIRWNRMGKAIQ